MVRVPNRDVFSGPVCKGHCKEIMAAQMTIWSYTPTVGFFDLSEKPEKLDIVTYAKIINIQNYLVSENEKFKNKEICRANKSQWESLKELSGKLQDVILEYWNIETL